MLINNLPQVAPIESIAANDEPKKNGFGDMLATTLNEAAQSEREAEGAMTAFINGEGGVHETVIAQEKAALQLRFALTTKNKAVSAYKDLMSTQI